ncbi:unnamed protein product [Coffea canephora]|uniref:DH200=94 genomic scaffold, scaffold_300 n=1 Tax=Coffea canephora TaxID=49390 RepID=A0A068VDR9_COFCA|nr:unnamed protein product [Coffea canephora]
MEVSTYICFLHSSTTLLDYIRKSKMAASEAGGITQGMGHTRYKYLLMASHRLVFSLTPLDMRHLEQ